MANVWIKSTGQICNRKMSVSIGLHRSTVKSSYWLGAGGACLSWSHIRMSCVYNYFIFDVAVKCICNSRPIQSNHKSSWTFHEWYSSGEKSRERKKNNTFDMDFYLNQTKHRPDWQRSRAMGEEMRMSKMQSSWFGRCRQKQNREQMFWQHWKTQKQS